MSLGPDKYAQLIRLLLTGSPTVQELSDGTDIHYETVRDHVHALRRAGTLYISGYTASRTGRRVRQWSLGQKSDVVAPLPTKKERNQESWQRRRERELAKREAERQAALTAEEVERRDTFQLLSHALAGRSYDRANKGTADSPAS